MSDVGFARTVGATLLGTEARLVDVQVALARREQGGERTFRIVGLPDIAMREGRERIRAALQAGGWGWPDTRATVNLAPAADRKQGAALDLAIALGLLGSLGHLRARGRLAQVLCVGEVALDGSIRPVRGVLEPLLVRGGNDSTAIPKITGASPSDFFSWRVRPDHS